MATFGNGRNGFCSHVPCHGNVLEWPRGLTRNCRSGIDRVCSDVASSAHHDQIGNVASSWGQSERVFFVDFKALPFGFKNNPSPQILCHHNCIAHITCSRYLCYHTFVVNIGFVFVFLPGTGAFYEFLYRNYWAIVYSVPLHMLCNILMNNFLLEIEGYKTNVLI